MQHIRQPEQQSRPLYAEAFALFHERTGKRFTHRDAMRANDPAGDRLLAETNSLILLAEELRKYVEQQAPDMASVPDSDDVADDLDEVWVEEARQLGNDARQMFALANEMNSVVAEVEENRPRGGQTIVLLMSKVLAKKMFDLAEFMEDVAETKALAAHGPFRSLVAKELEAISPEPGRYGRGFSSAAATTRSKAPRHDRAGRRTSELDWGQGRP